MSLYITNRVLAWTPKSICVRTMKSINTRFPKPLHLERAKVMHLTKPIKPTDNRSMAERCKVYQNQEFAEMIRNKPSVPVEEWMARQVKRSFFSSQMVAVFHREDITQAVRTKLWRRLKKNNMEMKVYNNKVVTMAVTGTKLHNFEPLLVSDNLFIVSEEPQVKEMLKITNKIPRIHLLGGFVIDRLMTADEMREFAKLPSLPGLHSQLSGILSSASSRTYQLLQANQQRLASNLGQLAKQMSEDPNTKNEGES